MQTSWSILPILRTETQQDLLAELFESSGPRTLSDLARSIGVDQTTVMREINRLSESGIVAEERVGRARTVVIDDSCPLVAPLRQLIRIAQPSDDAGDVIDLAGYQSRDVRSERRPLPSSRRRG